MGTSDSSYKKASRPWLINHSQVGIKLHASQEKQVPLCQTSVLKSKPESYYPIQAEQARQVALQNSDWRHSMINFAEIARWT